MVDKPVPPIQPPPESAPALQVSDVVSEAVQTEYERMVDAALSERPSFSMRTRIILAFGVFFLLCAGINAWVIYKLTDIQEKTHFLEVAGDYMSEIQQARRYEKNFLLYGTNLDDALAHVHDAQRILSRNRTVIGRIVGASQCETMTKHVTEYGSLLQEIGAASVDAERAPIEARLRSRGSEMVSYALDFVQAERRAIEELLRIAKQMAIVFLVVLAPLMVGIALLLSRQLWTRLAQFMAYAERVGEGDFSLITPKRKYRDEFSRLAQAFNRMVHELDRRHRILIESHKLRAIGTLVAGVAHELNNPLNNTMLIASRVSEDHEDMSKEELVGLAEKIIGETERSRRIVRNLLDFARETEVHSERLNIAEVVNHSVRLVENQIKMGKVKVSLELADELPPVHADAQMLLQVFVNLLLNAAEASETGQAVVVRTRNSVQEAGFVAVDIQDEGRGIPPHVLSRVFDPFFTTKTKGKGTGLGLSVSRGIVRKLGGYLRVKSTVGKGTTFTVLLPATSIPSDNMAPPAEP